MTPAEPPATKRPLPNAIPGGLGPQTSDEPVTNVHVTASDETRYWVAVVELTATYVPSPKATPVRVRAAATNGRAVSVRPAEPSSFAT